MRRFHEIFHKKFLKTSSVFWSSRMRQFHGIFSLELAQNLVSSLVLWKARLSPCFCTLKVVFQHTNNYILDLFYVPLADFTKYFILECCWYSFSFVKRNNLYGSPLLLWMKKCSQKRSDVRECDFFGSFEKFRYTFVTVAPESTVLYTRTKTPLVCWTLCIFGSSEI